MGKLLKMVKCALKTMIFFFNVEFALVSDDLDFDREKIKAGSLY